MRCWRRVVARARRGADGAKQGAAPNDDDHHRGGGNSELEHGSSPPRSEPGPLTSSMDLVQDGIDDAVGQDAHSIRQVGGEERFRVARRRHARFSRSRAGVRASASSAARIAAVAYERRDFAVPSGMPR